MDLGAVAALAVIALPGVVDEAAGDVDALPLGDVLVDGLGGPVPDHDVVPIRLRVGVLPVAIGRQPQLGDRSALRGVAHLRVGPDPA